jgi:hypothetical protein
MRIRTLAAATAICLALGLLSALPASATHGVQSITFPGSASEFYSPFGGPATITFTFDAADPDVTYEARIRPAGGSQIHSKTIFIDPDTQSSPRAVNFAWPALSVNSARTYVVAVYRGGVQQAAESFLLRPALARITGAAPNPFFPWIDDGHKDTTNVAFSLQADAAVEARVFRANANGNCCGPLILDESLGNLSAGPNAWVWDGQGEGEHGAAGNRPAGGYFVRVWADDSGPTPPAVSKAFKVTIARTYRATATKSKAGTQFHHTTESALVRGGDCFTHAQGGYLQVDCHGARMTVYYRWGLGSAQRIEKASFVIDNSNSECGAPRRKPGHSKHESFLTVTDAVSGITSCRIVTARITYSFPKAS